MKYLALAAILAVSPVMADPEPVGSPQDIIVSCMTYGLFVMTGISRETGSVMYATFRCEHMYNSDKPPMEAGNKADDSNVKTGM